MHVEQITTWDELAALEHEWNALAGDMPFRSWDWLATWWKHYGGDVRSATAKASDRQLYVLAVFADSIRRRMTNSGGSSASPRGISIGLASKATCLRWLGSGEVCTDHLSLICRPEDTETVADAIAGLIDHAIRRLGPHRSRRRRCRRRGNRKLLASLEERDCLVSRQLADSCWALDLPRDLG